MPSLEKPQINAQKKAAKPEEKPKISGVAFISMLCIALLVDFFLGLIQLIPVAGSIMASVFGIIPLMGFWFWYKTLGISFANPKKSISSFGASIIEFIPVVNALPAWTAEVIYMYVLQTTEDKVKKLQKVTDITHNILHKSYKTMPFIDSVADYGDATKEAARSVGHISTLVRVANSARTNRERITDVKSRGSRSLAFKEKGDE